MRHTLGIIAAQAVRTLGPLVTLPLISRSSDLADFGEYALYLTFAQAASVVVDFGFSFTGYGLVGRASDERTLFAQTTAARLITGIVVCVIGLCVAFVTVPQSLSLAAAACAYSVALGCSPLWFMNWRRDTARLVIYESIPVAAMAVGAVAVFLWQVPPAMVMAAGAVAGMVSPLRLSLGVWLKEPRRTSASLWPLLQGQLGVTTGRIVVVGYTVAIIPLGSFFVTISAVGHYAAVEKLGSVMGVIGIMAAQWLAPRVVAAHLDNKGPRHMAKRILVLVTAVPILFGLPLVLAGGTIVAVLFGPNFQLLDTGAAIVVIASIMGFGTTIIWSGLALPLGMTKGYLPLMALGGAAALIALGVFGAAGYFALCLSRLAAELVVLIASALYIIPKVFRRQG